MSQLIRPKARRKTPAPEHGDWRVPLEAFGGKTALEVAQDAYRLHVSQQKTTYVVTDEGATSNARFGLAYTAVGPDVVGGDFMENIPVKESGAEQAASPTHAE